MLEVREIDAFYGPVQVLWEVSFRVEAGEPLAAAAERELLGS